MNDGSIRFFFHHLCSRCIGKFNNLSHSHSTIHQHFSMSGINAFDKQHFYSPSAGDFFPTKTGGNDFGVIDDQQVSRSKNIREILDLMIDNLTLMPIEHQQTRMISRMNRMLRNQCWIKRKFEIRKIHGQPWKEPLKVGLME